MRKECRDGEGRLVSLETEPATAADLAEATEAGLVLVRRIEQLRVALPLEMSRATTSGFSTRPFDADHDIDAFLDLNNRAFAWHPDQSNWTEEQLRSRMTEPWFDPDGFLLHERDGRLAGFCWTKIHPPTEQDPELGEIFVIAVDPDLHGLGLGRSLTIAGLDHLAHRDVHVGMLHVEHDNTAARALYADLGFVEHDAHCWWEQRTGTPR